MVKKACTLFPFFSPVVAVAENLPNNRAFLLRAVFKTEEEICLNGSDCAESAALCAFSLMNEKSEWAEVVCMQLKHAAHCRLIN